jgi:hypothetical protein
VDSSTLLTVFIILVVATVLALIRTRRRDRCLKAFDRFPVTLATHNQKMTWGALRLHPTGMELTYPAPVVAAEGHLERSVILYKEQYADLHAVYRCPEGLSADDRARRETLIEQTRHPGLLRRLWRWIRNWMGMVRDALLQSVGMIVGVAKAKAPAGALIGRHDKQVESLSSEVIQHTGNAFDPLLEQHLFSQVVVQIVGPEGVRRSYCGWLKDYTSDFVEILDAYANTYRAEALALEPYRVGDRRLPNQEISIVDGTLRLVNGGSRMFYLQRLTRGDDWQHPIDAVVPPGFTSTITLPPELRQGTDRDVRIWMGTVERVDMVMPRQRAHVRHAAGGSDDSYEAHRGRLAEMEAEDEPPRTSDDSAASTAPTPVTDGDPA